MRRRIVERAFEDALGNAGVAQVCVTCGFPNEEGHGVVLLEKGEELGHCRSCENPVDCEGRALGMLLPGGEVRVVVISAGARARKALGAKRIDE